MDDVIFFSFFEYNKYVFFIVFCFLYIFNLLSLLICALFCPYVNLTMRRPCLGSRLSNIIYTHSSYWIRMDMKFNTWTSSIGLLFDQPNIWHENIFRFWAMTDEDNGQLQIVNSDNILSPNVIKSFFLNWKNDVIKWFCWRNCCWRSIYSHSLIISRQIVMRCVSFIKIASSW